MFTNTSSVLIRPMNIVKPRQYTKRSTKILKNYGLEFTGFRWDIPIVFQQYNYRGTIETLKIASLENCTYHSRIRTQIRKPKRKATQLLIPTSTSTNNVLKTINSKPCQDYTSIMDWNFLPTSFPSHFRLFHFVNNLETPNHTGSITTFIIILKAYNTCIFLATSCHWAEKSTSTFQLSTPDMSFNFWIRCKYATSAVIYNSYQPCQCDSWNR
jgi:hypothetical protein